MKGGNRLINVAVEPLGTSLILLNRQLQRNDVKTSTMGRLITTHLFVMLLRKMRYGLIRKLSSTPHVDKRALLPTRNILLAAV